MSPVARGRVVRFLWFSKSFNVIGFGVGLGFSLFSFVSFEAATIFSLFTYAGWSKFTVVSKVWRRCLSWSFKYLSFVY